VSAFPPNLTVAAAAGLTMMPTAFGRPPGGRDWKLGIAVASAHHRIVTRALVAGLVVLAVGLAGCGRKAALDPPPSANVTTPDGTTAPPPEKPNKPFFLDWVL
jgi:predicted small lipoprotein YifL